MDEVQTEKREKKFKRKNQPALQTRAAGKDEGPASSMIFQAVMTGFHELDNGIAGKRCQAAIIALSYWKPGS